MPQPPVFQIGCGDFVDITIALFMVMLAAVLKFSYCSCAKPWACNLKVIRPLYR
jgi:hypothetical protein